MVVKEKQFDAERSLYGIKDFEITNCKFISEIGESPIKEASNIKVSNSSFSMRYPFWHNTCTKISECIIDDKSRAPLWYDDDIVIENTQIDAPKAIRESKNIVINNCKVNSDEFGWNTNSITLNNSKINGFYAFMNCHNVELNKVEFSGKYSFQYIKNAEIKESVLDTKDALWHSENVTVTNSIVKGEYLGWYSKNLHLINCKIIGTQPLCYCEGLVLENCEMVNCDLAFEYSEVQATINSSIDSIKNPLSGSITAKKIDNVIFDEFRRDTGDILITQKETNY